MPSADWEDHAVRAACRVAAKPAALRSPEHYLRQARAKWRIIRRREMREAAAGRLDAFGDYDRKTILDAIRTAQAAAMAAGTGRA